LDGTIVGANASRQSRVPREQLKEAAQVSGTVREYLAELEQVNPVSDAETISTTDPDAVWATKGGPAMMAYYDNYLIDTSSRVFWTWKLRRHFSIKRRWLRGLSLSACARSVYKDG
jgi:hypothetical protein